MMFRYLRSFRQNGIMGLNYRNANYILRYNRREKYPIVDDKLKTKHLAMDAGIPSPELYGVIEIEHHIEQIRNIIPENSGFVIKPARGSGGNGILIISGHGNNLYYKGEDILRTEGLNYHLSNILSGLYSLGGQPDAAIVEYLVLPDPIFEPVSFRGVPDIRIIVLFGIPVMAMIRLPTRISDGKANLHQGAVGAGIDIASGKVCHAVFKNRTILNHPDTGNPVAGFKIPHWENLLELASQCCDLTGLAYIGVDIVLDRETGPMLLELNARPGLNIQIANQCGLLPRLKMAEAQRLSLVSLEDKVLFAKRHFGTAT